MALMLLLPAAGAAHASDSTPSDTYTVQPGDTLTTIAGKTGTSVTTIAALNGLHDEDTIYAGAVLRLREAGSQSQATAPIPSGGIRVPLESRPASLPVQAPVQVQTSAVRPQQVPLSVARPEQLVPTGAGLSETVSAASSIGRPVQSSSLVIRPAANAAVQVALQHTGAPYVFGGASPSGFDCSGFVQYVVAQSGRTIPRDLAGQYSAGSHPSSLEAGDLVFFRDTYEEGLSHSGIYIGNGQFVHAIDESRGVGVSNLNEPYYSERWYGSTRLQ